MNEKSGLYFHIPFCFNKCPYCDFYSVKYCEGESRNYVKRVIEEIKKYSGEFDTVYFGGGTPSAIPPELIGEILNASKEQFIIDENSEITVECNPKKELREIFEKYASYGINRISLGMQSAVDRERFALGRSAGRAEVERAVNAAKNAGIENVSLDLMLGIPNQTEESLTESLDFIDKMKVQHISAYMLKIEKDTRFYEMRDRLSLPDEDIVTELYLKTVKSLGELGFKQYEISNFAKKGFRSRHNSSYWNNTPYIGIGAAAHSYISGKRWWNISNIKKYCEGVENNKLEKEIEIIDADTHYNDLITTALRTSDGLNLDMLSPEQQNYLLSNAQHLIDEGMLKLNNKKLSLTRQGIYISDSIMSDLIKI